MKFRGDVLFAWFLYIWKFLGFVIVCVVERVVLGTEDCGLGRFFFFLGWGGVYFRII